MIAAGIAGTASRSTVSQGKGRKPSVLARAVEAGSPALKDGVIHMPISYTAMVVVGLYRKDIVNPSLFEKDELEAFGTYYDGNSEDFAIAGLTYVETESYAACELTWNKDALDLLHKEFFNITGQQGKVWLLPSGH